MNGNTLTVGELAARLGCPESTARRMLVDAGCQFDELAEDPKQVVTCENVADMIAVKAGGTEMANKLAALLTSDPITGKKRIRRIQRDDYTEVRPVKSLTRGGTAASAPKSAPDKTATTKSDQGDKRQDSQDQATWLNSLPVRIALLPEAQRRQVIEAIGNLLDQAEQRKE